MPDGIIDWQNPGMQKLRAVPVAVRTPFMTKIRNWLTELPVLVADVSGINETHTTAELAGTIRIVKIRWRYDDNKKLIMEPYDFNP